MTEVRKFYPAKWVPVFLLTMRETCNVRASCEAAGVSSQHANQYKDLHPEFAEMWENARQDAIDALEHSSWQRALHGVDKLKFDSNGRALVDPRTVKYSEDGEVVSFEYYTERTFDSGLAKFFLTSHRPEIYREKQQVTINLFNQLLQQDAERFGIDPARIIESALRVLASQQIIGELPQLPPGNDGDSS